MNTVTVYKKFIRSSDISIIKSVEMVQIHRILVQILEIGFCVCCAFEIMQLLYSGSFGNEMKNELGKILT